MERRVALVTAGVLLLAQGGPAAAGEPPRKEEEARAALWAALTKAKPKDLAIDAYAENTALTKVCFSAGGRVYLFSLMEGEVKEPVFQQPLPKINRITFRPEYPLEKDLDQGWFKLWADGQLKMTMFR